MYYVCMMMYVWCLYVWWCKMYDVCVMMHVLCIFVRWCMFLCVRWCMMMYDDVWWFMMMYDDVWCLMLHDDDGCSMYVDVCMMCLCTMMYVVCCVYDVWWCFVWWCMMMVSLYGGDDVWCMMFARVCLYVVYVYDDVRSDVCMMYDERMMYADEWWWWMMYVCLMIMYVRCSIYDDVRHMMYVWFYDDVWWCSMCDDARWRWTMYVWWCMYDVSM